MVDDLKLLEVALQCNEMTEKEREVMDILLELPELVYYDQGQLVPWAWGWKRRRSAVNTPLAPFPSPADSPPSSSRPQKLKFKPRVAFTKEQFLQQIKELAQQKKAYQEEQLLESINKLTQRKQVYQQELPKIESYLEKQVKFNNTLKELAARATTVAPSQS